MGINMLPEEIRNHPDCSKSIERLSSAFYQMIQEGSTEVMKQMSISDCDAMSVVCKTLVANMCKEAFNDAYVRYISGN